MKDFGFFCSHGSGEVGLDAKVLTELLESWSHVLLAAIKELRPDYDVHPDDRFLLQSQIAEALVPLVQLYIERVRNSLSSQKFEGLLPQKWSEEDKKEKERLAQIKEKGADAKYSEGWLIRSVEKMDSEQMESLRLLLESRLISR